jgi:hypothetical protein
MSKVNARGARGAVLAHGQHRCTFEVCTKHPRRTVLRRAAGRGVLLCVSTASIPFMTTHCTRPTTARHVRRTHSARPPLRNTGFGSRHVRCHHRGLCAVIHGPGPQPTPSQGEQQRHLDENPSGAPPVRLHCTRAQDRQADPRGNVLNRKACLKFSCHVRNRSVSRQ